MNLKKLLVPVLSLALLFPTLANAEVKPKATVNTPAVELRASLDHLLSEHFVLAVTSMTKAYDGAADSKAVFDALNQNALDMKPAIASIYGEAGAAEFDRIFRNHNNYTDDIVNATKSNDQAALKEVDKEVEDFVIEFSTFLATATEGHLPKKAAEDVIRLHEKQVRDTFDSYVKGDYKAAYETFREGFKTMFSISKALSVAIVAQMPEKFKNSKADTPAADLRSALNSLASEHVALATMEMQKEYEGAKDFPSLIWAETQHTADFKAAISSIYGAEGANQFEKIWVTDHINAQSSIAAAQKKGDLQAREAAKKRVEAFVIEFGGFLGAATAENLPAKAAQDAVRTHEAQVLQAFDEYVAGNYDAAYKTFREAYKLLIGVGQVLGDAIVTQFNDKFQVPADTGSMTTVWMKINSSELKINDKVTQMDTTPFMWESWTFIPLRYLSEGIGAEVIWEDGTRTIWVKAGNDTLTFWVGKDYMEVNGVKQDIGTKVFINKDGRTVIPLRFIAELLGWDVEWNDMDWSIKLTKAM
ncbi:copper amine oxidase N-terminal domain-containing protein [Paenibacillus eucommiae]|uniref:Uncharacterized protein YdcH (DUF465 family) n=1 Tax=Paenibacillus eucommiae TaxID=1355755 RepID=A0ABS4J3Y1_9BACL|nr:copper amine oxidase N-terminal domain-containing protein [Paenibacillus eucommiae]MBP1993931.1 uncharacterized protein YdcH (DUF465 family) [Paenibacillus eucommiae]